MDKTVTLHIVPHTHWDREWYFTLEEFRYRLIKLVDTLLAEMESGRITYFTLDGQTIALSDYLAVRPENKERILSLTKSGRLIIGPWYTQPNTFMSGAEAQIRNLLRGKEDMEYYGGGLETINYLPDQFGFNNQMPQIMQEFGMSHLVGARGLPKKCETYMKWKGSDDTVVKVCALPNSYNNANGFCDRDEAKIYDLFFGEKIYMPSLPERLDLCLDEQKRAIAPHVLAMNGVDHMYPNTSMETTIKKIKELHPEVEVVQSTFKHYIECVEASLEKGIKTYEGEQRDPRENLILPASQSMRMDVKMYNRKMEDYLERRVEPLISFMASLGEENLPVAELKMAWELMLENQAHDSLCCANSEPSYREIMVRFDKIEQICREICNELDQRLMRKIKNLPTEGLLLVNPSATVRNEPITVDVIVSNQRNFAEPHLFYQGKEITAHLNSVRTDSLLRFVPFSGWVGQLAVAIYNFTIDAGEIPPTGFKLLEIKGGTPSTPVVEGLVTDLNSMENEFLKVSVHANGTINVLDKRTNREFKGLNSFISNGETGGGFQHIPPMNDQITVSMGKDLSVSIVENNPLKGIINVSQSFSVPKGLSPDSLSRSCEKTDILISSNLILKKGAEYLEFETTINNTAKDHRLRVVFPTDIKNDKGFAGQPFDVVYRPVQPENVNFIDYSDREYEPYVGYHPMHDFCGIEDDNGGAIACGDGIMEYEILPTRNSLALTLLRATQKLHVGVMASGSKFQVYAAQLQGETKFRYAFVPFSGGYENGLKQVEKTRHPITFVQKDFLEAESMPDYKKPEEILDGEMGFIELEGNCVLTSIKPAEDKNGFIVRVYNPVYREEKVTLKIDKFFKVISAENVSLKEELKNVLPVSDHSVELTVGPKKIISVRLKLSDK